MHMLFQKIILGLPRHKSYNNFCCGMCAAQSHRVVECVLLNHTELWNVCCSITQLRNVCCSITQSCGMCAAQSHRVVECVLLNHTELWNVCCSITQSCGMCAAQSPSCGMCAAQSHRVVECVLAQSYNHSTENRHTNARLATKEGYLAADVLLINRKIMVFARNTYIHPYHLQSNKNVGQEYFTFFS